MVSFIFFQECTILDYEIVYYNSSSENCLIIEVMYSIEVTILSSYYTVIVLKYKYCGSNVSYWRVL